ncbi:MAG: ABC transporter permease [Tissierellia bacterium]|nr:ABC transporter permease [Tissierellia bacterium]
MKKYNKIWFILLSLALGFAFGAIALLIAGFNPLQAYGIILKGVFSRPKYISWTIIRATPVILTGLGVAFAFRTGTFNIGAEGQYIIGAMTAAWFGYFLNLPPVLHITVCLLAAAVAGGIWAGIAGFIKARFGVNEVITTIMLNWIAFYLNNFIIYLPIFKRPNSENSYSIQASAVTKIFQGLRGSSTFAVKDFFSAPVNIGFILAIITAIILWFILKRTTLGYSLKTVGLNQDAAEYGGINVKRNIVISMAISGAVCALGGATQVLGVTGNIATLGGMEGNGFDGIAVALLAFNHPIGAIFTGLFFGGLKFGASQIQRLMGAPYEMIQIVIGTIILFTSMPMFTKILSVKLKKRKRGGKDA